MDERTRVVFFAGLGAVIGGLAGYLLFTESGREIRSQLEPRVEELATELQRLATTFDRTRKAVADGWQTFSQAVNDVQPSGSERWRAR